MLEQKPPEGNSPDFKSPDWPALVRDRIGSLRIEPAQQEEIIAELAGHLEELYEGLRTQGLCESEALQRSLELEQEEINWRKLTRKIRSAKRGEGSMNDRTRQFWLPALASLAVSEGMLFAISVTVATHAYLWRLGGRRCTFHGCFHCRRRVPREHIWRVVAEPSGRHCLRRSCFRRSWGWPSSAADC